MKFFYTSLLLVLFYFKLVHNHAHSDEPLLLLVSFDGFRWDYLYKHDLPNFNSLKQNGAYADYIHNAFATVTFPNHWTIVTGLYEESHGIVQNVMYDPITNSVYDPAIVDSLSDYKWYAQNNVTEPIWATNQRHGSSRLSAAEWIGSDVVIHGQEIISIPYNHTRPYKEIIDEFIALFTRDKNPINFGAMYFDEPDHTGHRYGPYSKEMAETLKMCDETLGYLIEQLKSHHLFDGINLIVTSDHGMEQIALNRTRFLDQYANLDLFTAYGSRSVYNIFVKNESDLEAVYRNLSTIPNAHAYYKQDVPDELHYKLNSRVGQIVLIAELSYSLYINTQEIDWTITNGDHGFINNDTAMFPIFIGHGPAFKDSAYKIANFHNVDIYPLMCFILGITPAINNGSLENVIGMLRVNFHETGTNLFFAFLLIIPVTVVCFSLLLAICINKKRSEGALQDSNHGYSKLLTSEDAVLDIEEDEIMSRSNLN